MSTSPIIPREVDAWGRVTLRSDDALEVMYHAHDIRELLFVPDEEIDRYNELCEKHDKLDYRLEFSTPSLTPAEYHAKCAASWLSISPEFETADMRELLLHRCTTDEQRDRVMMEMDLFEERDLIPLLRLMASLVDHFRKRKIVWGVGRGSSTSSYCLFLLKVHRVDSIKYGLDIAEFLK